MSAKQLNSAEINLPAVAVANPASEEEAIEMIAVPNGNDEENAAVSTGTESTISSSSNAAAASYARQGTTFVKRGGSLVVAAAALAVIGATSVHFAGRPTKNFSSSKQVALSSGEIKIKGFTKVVGDGSCKDEPGGFGNLYDWVGYLNVGGAEACAKQCSKCPGGGQKGINGEKLVLRGFEYGDGSCACLVENVAEGELDGVCADEGALDTFDDYEGSGEIESVFNFLGVECWKIKSKTSKSRKSGSKGGKRG